MQRKLDAVRRVLADADRVAAALVQADREVTQTRAALRVATANYRAAQATRARAVLEAARAQLEVDAQQAVIDRRARATCINNARLWSQIRHRCAEVACLRIRVA